MADLQAKWWSLQSLPLFNLGWNVAKHFRDFLREEKGEPKARTKPGVGHNQKSNMTSITAGTECIELKDDGGLRHRGATS